MPESVGRWVLAIDLGSTGLKVGAVTKDGRIVGSVARELTTTFTDDGGVEQDPHTWWQLIREATRLLLDDGQLAPAELVAVGTTGQYASTVPVDADGQPVGPCLMWADDRGRTWSARAVGGPAAGYRATSVLPWLRYTGGLPSPGGADPTGHALYLKHARPELYARTATLLEPVDYLGLRLTGRAAATPASMVASWLTDNRPGAALRYVPSLVRRAGRDADRLPELLPAGSVLGELSADAAAHLGLLPGAPVVTGVPDLHAAHIASGAVDDFAAHLTISTTSWVSCAVPFKKTDVLHQMASVPGVRPGQYLVIDNHETAGVCLQWLRDGVLGGSYDELVALAEQSEPGAGGVLFTPWLKGERSPVDDRALRASFVNVSLTTDRADLVRAVLEGVAHNMRWLVEVADAFAGRRLEPIRALGGGAQSDLWCQVHADVLGRRVERVDDPEIAQLRGVALYALLALGDVTLDEAASRATASTVFEPGPASTSVYEPMHAEFTRLYGRLKGVHHRLNGRR
ncbi:MAG TPA: FGGY-family carbohydrate kinase [Actinomycetales bacterium]|nr:FGGY-family carbohydrate kinase [Actinomycetales bacterium]